ncbi:hypothetical protein K438DRAFT_1978783 [Mycena galopus ATCC 62051]|nr:hypothetical protein K438DRAFT_1978783 [Mycena galopus ATCC 62051]
MADTRASRRLRANNAAQQVAISPSPGATFFRINELRRLALSHLSLLPLHNYGQASQFTRSDVMSMSREWIMRYVAPFFSPAHHIPSLFYTMENTGSWIVGSVALAVLSFGADMAAPANLNLIASANRAEAWTELFCDVMGFTLRWSHPCTGYYATLGKRYLVFRHVDVPGKSITITTARANDISELFLHSRTTLMANAVTPQELVAVYPDLTSNFEGTWGLPYRLDTSPYPRSPFPLHIRLHETSDTLGHPCGSACPGKPRWSTDTAGIGHWRWAGVGNLEWDEDPPMSAPMWPLALPTHNAVLDFLHDRATPALITDIYNVDFKDGVYGSYVPDETTCTDDDGAPYHTYVVGRVCAPAAFVDANLRFRISAGGAGDEDLNAAFARQVIQLAAMVKEADEEDFDDDRKILVENFTDADRFTLLGGTWIEFMMSGPPAVHIEHNGELARTKPKSTAEYPMKVGDWVLVRASLHRWDDRSGYNIRRFSVVPQDIRILAFEEVAPDETTEEDTLSEKSLAPSTAGDGDDRSLVSQSAATSTVAVGARVAPSVKRTLSSTTDETPTTERVPAPKTPRRKRARKN